MRILLASLAGVALIALPAVASADTRVNGQGMIADGRTFAVSATITAGGAASGHATLINRGFSGDSGKGPFRDHIDITCGYRASPTTVVLGGTSRSNDSNLNGEAVFFTIQDNGNPGKNSDAASGANYFDGDPDTTGTADPATCLATGATDFGSATVLRGNFTIRETN